MVEIKFESVNDTDQRHEIKDNEKPALVRQISPTRKNDNKEDTTAIIIHDSADEDEFHVANPILLKNPKCEPTELSAGQRRKLIELHSKVGLTLRLNLNHFQF